MSFHKRMKGGALLCAILLLTTACQPTPKDSAVQEKGNLDSVISENTVDKNDNDKNQNVTEQEQKVVFQVTAAKDKFKVKVDATAIVPKVKNIPVVNVVRNDFSQEDIKNLCRVFFGDHDIYRERAYDEMSKAELQKVIDDLKNKAADAASNPNPDKESEIYSKPNYLKSLEALLKKAPETVDVSPITDFKYKQDQSLENSKSFSAKGESIYGEEGTINFYTSDYASSCQFDRSKEGANGYYASETNYIAEHGNTPNFDNICNYSREEAQQLSNEILEQLKISDKYGLSYMENAAFIQYGSGGSNVKNYSGYLLHYTRKYDGINENYDVYDGSDSIEEVNSLPYSYEKISFLVDDSGVVQFEWNSPMKVDKIQATNVKTLPLKKIEESFKKQIPITFASTSKETTVEVSEIRFGYMRVKNVNQPNLFTLIPVWDFISDMYGRTSLMTINAIDGSILDRRYGY